MTLASPNPDRLYQLLPAIYRLRDAEQGYPLQALLRVICAQVDVVEDDIRQLYDNWFIETAQDWAVPYIGDLIGYEPVREAGNPGDPNTAQGAAENKILIPRREVANTVAYRRRKGTLALLEDLAHDVAGWPARAVEFYKLLTIAQHLNYPQPNRGRTINIRDHTALIQINTPFDEIAHTPDIRSMHAGDASGRYNLPNIGLFVWRQKVYAVHCTPAYCVEEEGSHCFTFSALGQDVPLYVKAERELVATHIAEEMNLPVPIRRETFEQAITNYYGAGKSIEIRVQWGRNTLLELEMIKPEHIVATDLSGWHYRPSRPMVALDPELGRIAFSPSHVPKKVRVVYHYAFGADIGGGNYKRTLSEAASTKIVKVGEDQINKRIEDALAHYRSKEKPDNPIEITENLVIELTDNNVYTEPINLVVGENVSFQIRAAVGARPIIKLIDWQNDAPDGLLIALKRGSRLTLDGLLVTGRAVRISGEDEPEHNEDYKAHSHPPAKKYRPSHVNIRHCTLVPGWSLSHDCTPHRPAEISLELNNIDAQVNISHSILGSIQINEDEVNTDPISVCISDSIIDAIDAEKEAIGAPGAAYAHCLLDIRRCTLFGSVEVHAIQAAEDSIFNHCVNVARRQLGGLRFCYVPEGCRTPKRYGCVSEPAPQFSSVRYGQPQYAQLATATDNAIKRGASDQSEMGVFHDLYLPQREANLRTRLEEYTPAGMQVNLIFAN